MEEIDKEGKIKKKIGQRFIYIDKKWDFNNKQKVVNMLWRVTTPRLGIIPNAI